MEAQGKKYIKVVENNGVIPVGHIAMAGLDDGGTFRIMSKPYIQMSTDRELWTLYVEPFEFPPELFEIN